MLASSEQTQSLPLLTMFRLGLFQLGLGMMAVLTLGVLNRVMIDELAIPASIVAAVIAVHQFMAPARVWFGQLSDARPFLGQHRSGYIWLGTLLFTTIAYGALQLTWVLGDRYATDPAGAWPLMILLGLVFAGYGLALSASSTPFAALLVDVSSEEKRAQLVGIVWSMLTLGIAIGGISSRILLSPLESDTVSLAVVQASINRLFLITVVVVCTLAFTATWGVEKRFSQFRDRQDSASREDSISLGHALKVLTANRQTGVFFTFLISLTLSLFMQEPVLEPFGGQVFGLSVGQTSMFNSLWGIGTLIGISSGGAFLIPKFGKRSVVIWGCLGCAICFGSFIVAGALKSVVLLEIALVGFGLMAGLATAGSINLMLDLTAAATAGTFIGAWGLAQAMSRGLAVVAGGGVLDIGRLLFTDNLVAAYGLVFAVQAAGMITAVILLQRVDIAEFKAGTADTLTPVLAQELD